MVILYFGDTQIVCNVCGKMELLLETLFKD